MTDYPPHGLTADRLAAYHPFDVDTPNIDKAVDAVVEGFRETAGWHVFPEHTETLVLDGEGGPILVLPTLRVVNLLMVAQLGLEVSPTAYSWSVNGEVKLRAYGAAWTEEYQGIQVTLTHGFDPSPALLEALAQAVGAAAANPLGIPEVIGPFQFTTAPVGDGADTLSRYKLPWKP